MRRRRRGAATDVARMCRRRRRRGVATNSLTVSRALRRRLRVCLRLRQPLRAAFACPAEFPRHACTLRRRLRRLGAATAVARMRRRRRRGAATAARTFRRRRLGAATACTLRRRRGLLRAAFLERRCFFLAFGIFLAPGSRGTTSRTPRPGVTGVDALGCRRSIGCLR